MKRLLLIGVLLLAGCGESEPKLSTDQVVVISGAEADLSFYCLDGSGAGKAPRHVDRLIRLYRDDPDAIYETTDHKQRTMSEVLKDVAATLDKCDPGLARQIDREL